MADLAFVDGRRLRKAEDELQVALRELREHKKEAEAKKSLAPPRPGRSNAPSLQQVDDGAQERARQLQEALQKKLLKTEADLGECRAQVFPPPSRCRVCPCTGSVRLIPCLAELDREGLKVAHFFLPNTPPRFIATASL